MSRYGGKGPHTVTELHASVLAGEFRPPPDEWWVTGASYIYQTTQFPNTRHKYHNFYLLMRVESSFGACSLTRDEMTMDAAESLSGRPLTSVLRDERLPVRIAAMDAYLGAVFPHRNHCSKVAEIAGGSPSRKAEQRDELIAEIAGIRPGRNVALIGVVEPLVAAIRRRGGLCLPCDLHMRETRWGDLIEKDMNVVLKQADQIICTGMTLGNGTFDLILEYAREKGLPLTVYAQTGSAVVARFVGYGVTSLVAEPFPFTQFSADVSRLYCYVEGG